MKELKKLNLGCGKDIKKGYINIDQSKLDGVDVVHDLNKYPWPFPKNYFDEVYARDAIEHLKDIFKVMNEIKEEFISKGISSLRSRSGGI